MFYVVAFRLVAIVVIIFTGVVSLVSFKNMVSVPIEQRQYHRRRLAFSLVALVFLLSGLVFLW